MIAGKLALGGLSLEFGGAQKRFDELSAKVEELGKRHEKLLEEEPKPSKAWRASTCPN